MAWVYLDDQFPDHPKVAAAGGDAAWLFVCGLAYVKRYSTEGEIPKGQITKLSDRKQPAKLARRLVEVGLWEEVGNAYRIHDYHQWNRTGEARSAAARKAARARWRNGDKAPPEHPPDDAEAMRDACETHTESHSDGTAEPDALTDASTCPLPQSPTEDLTSSYGLTTRRDSPDDDDRLGLSPEALVGAVIATLARRDLDERQRQTHLAPVGDVQTWLSRAEAQRLERHADSLTPLVASHPNASPSELAELIDPLQERAAKRGTSGERIDHTFDDQQRAQRAAEIEHMQVVSAMADEKPDVSLNLDFIAAIRAQHPLATRPEESM